MELMHFTDSENRDLYPVLVGHYQCPSLNSYGPHVRDYCIVHCVLKGKGTLYNARGAHPVSEGELFVIREGEVTTYVADKDDPWEYTWLGFSGIRAKLFDNAPDVLETPADLDTKLFQYVKRGGSSSDIFSSISVRAYISPLCRRGKRASGRACSARSSLYKIQLYG